MNRNKEERNVCRSNKKHMFFVHDDLDKEKQVLLNTCFVHDVHDKVYILSFSAKQALRFVRRGTCLLPITL